MNKKGFTLIEVIICLVLIVLIGAGSIFVTVNNNKKSGNLNDKIIDAASIYLNTEIDEYGNSYEYGLLHGAKGVQISIKTLEDKGYLSKSIVDSLEKENKGKDLYIFASLSTIKNSNDEECKLGSIEYNLSWADTSETIYLCPYNDKNSDDGFKDPDALYNVLLAKDYRTECTKGTVYERGDISREENNVSGFCYISGEEYTAIKNGVYYFKGDINNNYLKIDGINKLFRIVRTTENSSIKIIEEDRINNSMILYSNSYYKEPFTENKYYKLCLNVTDTIKNANLQFGKKDSKNYYFDANMYLHRYNKLCMKNYNSGDLYIHAYRQSSAASYNVEYKLENVIENVSWDTQNIDIELKTTYFNNPTLLNQVTLNFELPIYKLIYQPLSNNYNNIKSELEQYIDKDYKWCETTENSFDCSSNETIESDFGLLSEYEYKIISNTVYNDDEYNNSFYGYNNVLGDLDNSDSNGEFTLDLESTVEMYNGYSNSTGIGGGSQYLRPAYVIKGNSKIVNGDGTENNPYIINGLTN